MRFGMLGPLEVWGTDGSPVRVPELKVRALLTALLVREGRPATPDALIDDLWGERLPANPARVLRAKLSQLRGVLEQAEPGGRERVVHSTAGYRLEVGADDVDAARFRSLVERSHRAHDPRAKAVSLAEALALWRGPVLADFADEPFTRTVAVRLEEERLAVLEEQAVIRLELGEHHLLAEELGELVGRHPLRERLSAVYMRALYRAGRQAEAFEAFERLRNRLVEELGVDPGPGTVALWQQILRQDPELEPGPVAPTALRPRTNVPAQVSDIIGRECEVEQVRALVAEGRLVTLTGPGGVAKTRLALELASGVEEEYPDGVWLVELGSLPPECRADDAPDVPWPEGMDPGVARVAEAVVAVAGVGDLSQGFSASRTLLVLDNCEHIVEPVAELAQELLRSAPQLRLLVTSREPLGISGERVYEVSPLRTPGETGAVEGTADQPGDFSAVRLFAARAAATAPRFTLDDQTFPYVASICQRLDGLPLALELAANRVRALGVRELAARLDDRFGLLAVSNRGAPRRQQTLRAMIEWSWDLLTGPERMVLRRLVAHAEGCTLEGAEVVAGGEGMAPGAVLDHLVRLVERSLVVVVDDNEEVRYRLLETIGTYAAERLEESGEVGAVHERHMHHYLELAERADPLLRGRDQRRWLRRLDSENANMRAAADTAVGFGDADTSLRLALALVWHRYLRGRLEEAYRSLIRALALPGGTATLRARAAAWRAGLALKVEEPEDPVAVVKQALDGFDGVDGRVDERERALAEWFLSTILLDFGELAVSEDLVGRALTVFRAQGDRWGIAAALSLRAWLAQAQGRLTQFEADGMRALELFREIGDRWGQLQAMPVLGSRAEIAGDYTEAARMHREGLRIAEELGLWSEVSYRLSELGRNALLRGDYQQAEDFHERGRRLAAEQGDLFGQRHAEFGLGLGARREGRLDVAETHFVGWLERLRGLQAPAAEALVLAELGFVAELRGDAEQALRNHTGGLAVARTTGSPRKIALALEGLAGAWMLAGESAHAAYLLGVAVAARASVEAPLPDAERGDVERATGAARAALGQAGFTAEFERGLEADLDEVVRWEVERTAG